MATEAVGPKSYLDAHRAIVRTGAVTIVDLLDNLPWFSSGADWTAWRAYLCAKHALPMTEKEEAIFRECTGRTRKPTEPAREACLIAGRRGRKSAIEALEAVYYAAFREHDAYLAPGERATVLIMARSKTEAKTIRRYVEAILDGPLAELMDGEATEELIRLHTRCDILIRAASVTAGRSFTCVFAALDEAAYFPTDDAAEPDVEILRGIRPSQLRVPNPSIAYLSSPAGRRGILWDAFEKHYGKDDSDVLVWKASTLRMHDTPEIRTEVARAYKADPIAAAAEFGAEFRSDADAYVSYEALMAVTDKDIAERPPDGRLTYYGFADPSGGNSDSFTLGISHWDHDRKVAVLDAIREVKAPFDPYEAVDTLVTTLKAYRVTWVNGDKYAGEWPPRAFARHELYYLHAEETKSEIYKECLAWINAKAVRILDHPVLEKQLLGLDRRVARGGRDSIDHEQRAGAHDDVANAACGALLLATKIGQHTAPPATPAQPLTLEEQQRRRLWEQIHEMSRPDTEDYEGPPRYRYYGGSW
jgi:hypothetical protein